ncbi:MAG: phosphatidate cytidylyltransferase [Holosporaceae bacterium]|jgi:phosphatidate cytidylyltransferase|nr:phosphatidate cytidylyltransferase [Holosporaceae bacterium]
MENSAIGEKILEVKVAKSEKQEFACRLFSSFLFILVAILLFLVPYWAFFAICWSTYVFLLYEIFSRKIKGKMLLRSAMALFCGLGIYSFIYCLTHLGQWSCMYLICISSFTDIGAYSFGKLLKGPKLCPKISPKKTWAGLFGGVFFGNLAVFCLEASFHPMEKVFMVNFWTIQLIVFASIAGDLLESWFKRRLKVKDMGNLFPGHGGVMDRLDSLLLASMVLAAMNKLY